MRACQVYHALAGRKVKESRVPNQIESSEVSQSPRPSPAAASVRPNHASAKSPESYLNIMENALRVLYYIEKAVCASQIASQLFNCGLDAQNVKEPDAEVHPAGLIPFVKMELREDAELNSFQQLLIYLLHSLYSSNLRRHDACCYEQLYTPEGYYTHAWVPKCTIEQFVHRATRKETNFDQWQNVTKCKGGLKSVAEYLTTCIDVQFPDLVKSRSIFSFRNGVYDARGDRFYDYSNGDVPADFVACKYFDLLFDSVEELDSWYDDIATPNFQAILDYQEFPRDVSRWMYVMLGRLLYDVNDLDHWQVIPYLKGQACSGKSTILLRVCRNFYERGDVGVLSNNIEKKFGLAAFADKYMFVAPEIKADLQIEQAEFQSLVSGEDMSICRKYQTAETREWRVPGIMAGNETPGWTDNSGSITRRIVLFEFSKKVEDGDMDLGKKLGLEMARLLCKCNKAYHTAVRDFAKENIWKNLPPYFHTTKKDLTETTNYLEHFLTNGPLQFGRELCMPWKDFLVEFNQHVAEHGFPRMNRVTRDLIVGPFLRHGLQKGATKEHREYQGRMLHTQFVNGVDRVHADNGLQIF